MCGPIFSLVFGLGAALAALSRHHGGADSVRVTGMGDKIIIVAFVVVVIGGIGSIKGAFIGAFWSGLWTPSARFCFRPLSSPHHCMR